MLIGSLWQQVSPEATFSFAKSTTYKKLSPV